MTETWIRQVLAGDQEAFRHLVRAHQDRAWNIALSVVKSPDRAQDVVQTAFVNAWLKLATFSGRVPFEAWFYRIVVNVAIQDLRKRAERTEPLTEGHDVAQTDPSGDEAERVRFALVRMKPNEALALNLHYLDGFSIREITTITGWTEANAKVILHRARESLRRLLHAESEFPTP